MYFEQVKDPRKCDGYSQVAASSSWVVDSRTPLLASCSLRLRLLHPHPRRTCPRPVFEHQVTLAGGHTFYQWTLLLKAEKCGIFCWVAESKWHQEVAAFDRRSDLQNSSQSSNNHKHKVNHTFTTTVLMNYTKLSFSTFFTATTLCSPFQPIRSSFTSASTRVTRRRKWWTFTCNNCDKTALSLETAVVSFSFRRKIIIFSLWLKFDACDWL